MLARLFKRIKPKSTSTMQDNTDSPTPLETSTTSLAEREKFITLQTINTISNSCSQDYQPNRTLSEFSFPLDVTISKEKNIFYITDTYNRKIRVFGLKDRLFKFDIFPPGNPRCVEYDRYDDTIIVSCDDNRIYKMTFDGKDIIWKSDDEASFNSPRGVLLDQSGEVFVCDMDNHKIKVLSNIDGKLLREFGKYGNGDGHFYNPKDVEFDLSGNLIVSDRGNHRLVVVSKLNGKVIRKLENGFGTDPGQFNLQEGIVVDSSTGNIIVCDSMNHRIQIFKSNFELITMFGSYGTAVGQFEKPTGVDLDESTGELYVVEWSGERLQIFKYHLLALKGARWLSKNLHYSQQNNLLTDVSFRFD